MSPKSKGRKKPAKHRDPRVVARHAAMEAARKQSRRRKWSIAAAVLVVVLVYGLLSAVIGDGESDLETAETDRRTPVSLPTPASGASITGDTPCPNPDGSAPRTTAFAKPPPMCIAAGKTYVAEMQTSKGLVTIALDAVAAPLTVNNFVVLSRYHFFDTLPFHRIATGFVIQGGSPDATGTGSPGYSFADEKPPPGAYKVGSVAMANSGANTNGSQFFIIVGQGGTALSPDFSLFGQVTGGMDVVTAIEAAGSPETPTDPDSGKPTEVVTIQSVTIKET